MSYRFRNIRLILAVAGFLGVVFAPPWIVFCIALALSMRYRAWEVVAMGMWMDLLWMQASVSLESLPLATMIAFGLVTGLEPFRRELLLRTQLG